MENGVISTKQPTLYAFLDLDFIVFGFSPQLQPAPKYNQHVYMTYISKNYIGIKNTKKEIVNLRPCKSQTDAKTEQHKNLILQLMYKNTS